MSTSRLEKLQRHWSFDLPAVKPYYAVKCNPDPKLIGILRESAFGFDCASQRELSMMKTQGHLKDSIVYANPCKSEYDLEFAKKYGSPLTVVDSCEEIAKLDELSYGGPALIRIKVDDTGSTMPFGAKFGAEVRHVEALGEFARRRNVPLRGISFHVGSQSKDVEAHGKAIRLAIEQCKKLLVNGHRADIVDIGGGFVSNMNDFTLRSHNIRAAIHEKAASGIRFIAEPGRFFAKESQDLFVQVIGKKPATGGIGWRYTLDESIYGQFTNILFDHQKPRWLRISRCGEEKKRAWGKGVLFGRTCDSLDVIARSEKMEELEVGDWLWFPHMGAYTTATASEFNGFPKPPVFVDEENGLPNPDLALMYMSVETIQYITPVDGKAMLL